MRGPRGILLALLLLGLAAVSFSPATGAQEEPPAVDNPLAGVKWYVDKGSPSYRTYRRFRRRGDAAKADLIWKIAREPKNVWVGAHTSPRFTARIREIFRKARRQRAMPLLTVLRAESNRCGGGYDGGGKRGDRKTRRWYRKLARAIGRKRVLIAFEPDSLGTIRCHARGRRDDRYRLLRYGVKVLTRNPNTYLYIEATASDWQPAGLTAKQLRMVGIARARGFMLNATHYDWTASNISYGRRISSMTGGKHFVINTAENGRGPFHFRRGGRRINVWCNPPGRGLGPPPTTETSDPLVDAYLWINRPGYGQSCAGQKIDWNLERALRYARLATDWESPPG